jgi:hypothetical protein
MLCVWSVQLATRPNLTEDVRAGVYLLTTPTGEEHQFSGILKVATWATANALDRVTQHELLRPPEGDSL